MFWRLAQAPRPVAADELVIAGPDHAIVARGDWAGLLHPPVVLVRNVLGAMGYAIGLLMKATGNV